MRTLANVVDEYLVLGAQQGQVEAFESLARRWHPRLLRHARRLTGETEGAQEAVQDAWLSIARGLARLQDPASFGAWALRVTGRRCADWIADRQRRRLHLSSAAADHETTAAEPAHVTPDVLITIRQALRQLPPDQRALLAMVYVEGLSLAEVANALDVPVGTVKSRLFHARAEIRAVLEV